VHPGSGRLFAGLLGRLLVLTAVANRRRAADVRRAATCVSAAPGSSARPPA
jgi:hypothetical protein